MDRQTRKLLKFDLRDGTFIEEKNSIIFAQSFSLLNDTTYIFYTNGDGSEIPGGSLDWDNKIIITDRENLNISRKYFPGECRLIGQYPFIESSNSFKVRLPYNDTIYEVTQDTIRPSVFVDFDRFGLPDGYYYMSFDQQREFDLNKMACLMNVYESDQYFLFKWGYENRLRSHLWSKSSQEGIDFYSLFDDIDGLNWYINFRKLEKDKLVATFNSVDIITQEGVEDEEIYTKLINKGWNPDETSNPIIALYEIDFK
jgi:hypothetical protein